MSPESTLPSERRRLIRIGLAVAVAFGCVTVFGVLSKPQNPDPEQATDNRRSDDITEVNAIAFGDMPECQEINRIRHETNTRLEGGLAPVFDPHSFDRVLELTRHSNSVCRSQAMVLLGTFGFRGRNLPFSTNAETVRQLTRSHDRVTEAIADNSAAVRGVGFQLLGLLGDDRFVAMAKEALQSDNDQERLGAKHYFELLAKKNRPEIR